LCPYARVIYGEDKDTQEEAFMQSKKWILMLMTLGALLVIATGLWLATAQPVGAQCGSAASSCKNCHEVQGEMPVNTDGTGWHQSHAFGDFCYICHAGNNQAEDKVAAHTGMVAPLSDVQAACQQCHFTDLEARAQVYASLLGVEVGIGTGAVEPSAPVEAGTGSAPPVTTVLDVDDPNLVDYVQRYNEIVLGKKPVNWGNVILIGMIAMLAVGGGAFVIHNEKLVKVTFGETKKVEGEYPAEVIEMLPALARLNPKMRKSLKDLLEDPKKMQKAFNVIDTIYSDKE
jgi:hypothetical protein